MQPSDDIGSLSHLLENVVLFGRVLRRAGITVGTGQILDVVRALPHLDIGSRDEIYHASRSIFVGRHEDLPVFDILFDMFWKLQNARSLAEQAAAAEQMSSPFDLPEDCLPDQGGEDSRPKIMQVASEEEAEDSDDNSSEEPEERVLLAYSSTEILRQKDFEAFSKEEMQRARQLMAEMRWKVARRRTRRLQPNPLGDRLDLRRTIRRNMKHGAEIVSLARRRNRTKPRPLVLICDISGSMDRYSRILLQFLHTVEHGLDRVEAFVFGTRLTRITRQLRTRDISHALNEVSKSVQDWSGGTRIGESLRAFNRDWSKRVLGRGAIVLIISDGWDRGDVKLLEAEMSRLQRNCYRLIWLNPLLGLPSYQPLTQGIQAALPYVDDFMAIHNLESLEELGRHLERVEGRRPTRRHKATVGAIGAEVTTAPTASIAKPKIAPQSPANGAHPDEPPTVLYSDAPTTSGEQHR